MAFVHYNEWYPESDFATEVANAHPLPYEISMANKNSYGNVKVYKLKCFINMNPIRKVEYNASQLTDMFERLNQRVSMQMEEMQQTIAALKAEVKQLREQKA